jgi:hypothetical protein
MATVNKDFKIKSGLVVEGATGTINGHDILTKKQDDQDYIIGLIGGTATPENTPDTVVKRDGTGSFSAETVSVEVLSVSGIGTISDDDELLIAASAGEDIRLTADDIRMTAVDDIRMTASGDILLDASQPGMGVYVGSIDPGNTVVTESIMDAHIGDNTVDGTSGNTITDRIATAAQDAREDAASDRDAVLLNYTQTADLDTTVDGYGYLKSADLAGYATETYADGKASAALQDAQTYTDNQIQNGQITSTTTWSSYKTNAEIGIAQTAAQDYADAKINDGSNATDKAWSAYKTSTEIGLAQAAAETHADEAVAALVDSAPAMLDTLNELAAALQDNPDVITDLQNVAAGKQDTLTPGNGIVIDDNLIYVPTSIGSGISVTPSNVEIDRAVVDTWYDAAGSADTAEDNANTYTDNAITNGLAVGGSIKTAIDAAKTDANDYTDTQINSLTTADIEEGINAGVPVNMYFTDSRAKSAAMELLVNSNQSNITIAYNNVGDGLLITAENGVADSDTDDLVEGTTNLYFTNQRALEAAAQLLTQAQTENITINGTANGLTIIAENGVADSTTDDLEEGSTNKYFTDARAQEALDGTTPNFVAVELGEISKSVAGTTVVPVAGIATAYSWPKADYRSAEFLVKVANGDHTEVSKVLVTLHANDNISMTEYGIVGTNGSLGSVSAVVSGNDVQLQVTTVNNTSTLTVVGTLLA